MEARESDPHSAVVASSPAAIDGLLAPRRETPQLPEPQPLLPAGSAASPRRRVPTSPCHCPAHLYPDCPDWDAPCHGTSGDAEEEPPLIRTRVR